MHTRKLRLYQDEIRPEMLDYNGHVTEGWYVLLFGHASDALYEKLGMDARWRASNGRSLYTVESHVRYLRELALGDRIEIISRIIACDSKRLHFAHEMERDGELVATEELLALCVDTRLGRSVPFEAGLLAAFKAHCTPSPPSYSGRRIALS
ncbi:MAG TPA: thioesterase family protein [Kiloniellales bacterium]|nr:thioesterase family protein [Kiloniellales bacterium]